MNILLTNDDGLETGGLKALYQELIQLGKTIIISPITQQSAVSHAITIFSPLFVQKITTYLDNKTPLYAVDGTPADCVKLGLGKILKEKPDIVVSGINAGANVGVDIFYSGTVAAAIEGALWGITSFAVSLEKSDNKFELNFSFAAKSAVKIIKSLLLSKPLKGNLFNINVPAKAGNRIKGIQYTRQDCGFLPDQFVSGVDPRGRNYYWVKPIPKNPQPKPKNNGILISDIKALKTGYISITPLKANLTDDSFIS